MICTCIIEYSLLFEYIHIFKGHDYCSHTFFFCSRYLSTLIWLLWYINMWHLRRFQRYFQCLVRIGYDRRESFIKFNPTSCDVMRYLARKLSFRLIHIYSLSITCITIIGSGLKSKNVKNGIRDRMKTTDRTEIWSTLIVQLKYTNTSKIKNFWFPKQLPERSKLQSKILFQAITLFSTFYQIYLYLK